jgi:uncharacterized protein (TIGR02118 family)
MKKGMIKLSIFYPYSEGKKFDMDYYSNNHVPMVNNILGNSLRGMTIDKGLSGGVPGAKLPYMAIGNMFFDSMNDMQTIFASADQIMRDLPNFTNIDPVFQVSEVIL